MIKLDQTLLSTKIEPIPTDKFKEAFSQAIQVKLWLNNRRAYGLAANQVGIPFRFFVVRKPSQLNLPADIFLNPILTLPINEEPIESEEYCLSYPGRHFIVLRYKTATLSFVDPRDSYKERTIEISDLLPAIVVQHEISHLEGKSDLDLEKECEEYIAKKKTQEEANKIPEIIKE